MDISSTGKALVMFVAAAMVLSALAVLYENPQRSTGEPAASQPVQTISGNSLYSPSLSSAPLNQEQILALLNEYNVPAKYAYLPSLHFNASSSTTDPSYVRSPAPMGISDFGYSTNSGVYTKYSYTTSGFLGSAMFEGMEPFSLQSPAQKTVAIQLNTVLSHVTVNGVTNNVFWIQNVMLYTPSEGTMQFVSNIWSLSSPSMELQPNSILSGNGIVVPNLFYYYAGPTISVPATFTAIVYVDSVMNDLNNAVAFSYEITGTESSSTVPQTSYDIVTFNSVLPGTVIPASPAVFAVNGNERTPAGLLYDSELMATGPGGGSSTSIYFSNGQLKLQYKGSTGTYSNVPAAFNYGANTGETIQGLSVWWTSAQSPIAHMSLGPSILVPMWGSDVSRSGGTNIQGTIDPANAFFFINAGTTFNSETAGWGAISANGSYVYALPGGLDYSAAVLMSEFQKQIFTAADITGEETNETEDGGPPANTSQGGGGGGDENETAAYFNVSLDFDRSTGVYTPLYANGNDQLKYLTVGSSNFTGVVNVKNLTPKVFVGDGSTGDPYIVENNQYGQMDQLFARTNDYMFPSFTGIKITNTNASVQISDPSSFAVKYPTYMASLLSDFGLPSFNALGFQFINTTNIAFTDAQSITGWFASTMSGVPAASVIFWNSGDFIVASNNFNIMGTGLMIYNENSGSSGGTVWGNHFLADPITESSYAANLLNGADPVSVLLMGSDNLVYNNYFGLGASAVSPSYDQFAQVPATYSNSWDLGQKYNLSYINTVMGYELTGSIVETSYQGGNYWENFNGAIPFSDGGKIAVGGDFYPLVPPTYSVTFSGHGLPAGSTWAVTLGQSTISTSADQIQFEVKNGTYNYKINKPSTYSVTPSTGTIYVTGDTIATDVYFSLIQYQLTFTQSGHPYGELWSVDLSGTQKTSTGNNITYLLPNGTYNFDVSGNTYYLASPDSGIALVNGEDTAVVIQFVKGYYPVTFTEAGLPSGSAWSVYINGVQHTASGSSITVELTNGTYAYSTSAPTGYRPVDGSGLITVFGQTMTEPVQFEQEMHTVIFNANGLITGIEWGINFNGQLVNTTTATLSFEVANGNYTYEVAQVAGYSLAQNSSYVLVEGNNVTVNVNYSANPNHAMNAGLISIGAVVGIGAGIGIAYMFWRKP